MGLTQLHELFKYGSADQRQMKSETQSMRDAQHDTLHCWLRQREPCSNRLSLSGQEWQLQMTASKEMGTSVLQQQGTEFYQQTK